MNSFEFIKSIKITTDKTKITAYGIEQTQFFEAILTLLQNKRLHSELTDETFDVDSAKRLEVN